MRTIEECIVILDNFGFDYDQIRALYSNWLSTFDIYKLTAIVLNERFYTFKELRDMWYDHIFPNEDIADVYWRKFVSILLGEEEDVI